jgi:8-oxo-dGTP diphosphatase
MAEIVEAAVAVILRDDGQVLLGQRPEGKPWAGWWEFPGGKIEIGETPFHALQRELHEELGIDVADAFPWITRVFSYPERTVKLRFFTVRCWQGEPHGKENQQLSWQRLESVTVAPLLPANEPVLDALRLPTQYAITNREEMGEVAFMAALEHALQQGIRLIQVREKHLSPSALLCFTEQVIRLARCYQARVVVNADIELAKAVGADGVHLSSAVLMDLTHKPQNLLVGASCHDAAELEQAAKLGLDYAALSPVLPTMTHPDAVTLGWDGFAALVCEQPMPIYALGGMAATELETAWKHGGHGVAMLRDAWK